MLTAKPALLKQVLLPSLLPALVGGLLAWISYSLLPLFSIESPPLAQLFLGVVLLMIGGGLYRLYWQKLFQAPFGLLYFFLIGWPLVNYLSVQLIRVLGLNLHLRPLLFLGLGLPAGMFFLKDAGRLLVCFPFLKYLLAFVGIVLVYFFCYNGMATDLSWMMEDFWSEHSTPALQMSSYCFTLMSILLSASAVLRLQKPQEAFEKLNSVFVLFSALLCLVIILGYPLNFLTAVVDGFKRAEGLLDHPNPYAHHMGIVLLYLVGLLGYIQEKATENKTTENKMPVGLSPKWLIGAILVHLIAFLLGISKTAIFTFLCCLLLYGVLTLCVSHTRKLLLNLGGLLLLLVPLGLFTLRLVSDQDFIQLLNSRVEDTKSLLWRTNVWNALLADSSGGFLLWGHGFTAASTRIFQLTYNTIDNLNPLILVHNGYLSLFYDFGALGALFFLAVASLAWQAFRIFRNTAVSQAKVLMATVLSLCVYMLIACGFDEMTYMFDAAMLFWVFSTLLLSLVLREGWV